MKLTGVLKRSSPDIEPSDKEEPCAGCGEETAVGATLFPERHSFDRAEGGKLFLCDECYARLRAAKRGETPTEADLEVIAGNGLMIGAGFMGGGGV
jgi:hypothetical protein